MIDITTGEYTRYFAFKYQWYINAADEHWKPEPQNNRNAGECLRYRHASNDPATFLDNTVKADYARLHSFCCSVWHDGLTDGADDAFQSYSATDAYLTWLMGPDNPVPDFKLWVLYEKGSSDYPARSAADWAAIFEFYRPWFTRWSYAKHRAIHKTRSQALGELVYVDNAPMFYWYKPGTDPTRHQAMIDGIELYEAAHPGETIYIVADLWTNFSQSSLAAYFDAFCKYSTDDNTHIHTQAGNTYKFQSYTVCPGFHNPPAAVRVPRSISGFRDALTTTAVRQAQLAATGNALDLVAVSTWDEYPEFSVVYPSFGFATAGIYEGDEYLYAMRELFPPVTKRS